MLKILRFYSVSSYTGYAFANEKKKFSTLFLFHFLVLGVSLLFVLVH